VDWQFYVNDVLRTPSKIRIKPMISQKGIFTIITPYDLAVAGDDVVRVNVEGIELIEGEIKKIVRRRSQGIRTLTCVNYTNLLLNKHLVTTNHQVYLTQDAGLIVEDIIDTYFSGILTKTNVDTATGVTIDRIDGTNKTAFSVIRELALRANCDFYVDNDKDLHFFVVGSRTAKQNIGEDDIFDIEIAEDILSKKDLIRVIGDGVSATAGTGDLEHLFTDRSISDATEAQNVADYLLAFFEKGKVRVTVHANKFYNVLTGEKIEIHTPPDDLYNTELVIQNIEWVLEPRKIDTVLTLGAVGTLQNKYAGRKVDADLSLKFQFLSTIPSLSDLLADKFTKIDEQLTTTTVAGDGEFGHIVSTLRVNAGRTLAGLTFGRNNLFYVDNINQLVYEINSETMALINSWATPSANPVGLAYKDANSIWVGDRVTHEIYERDPDDGAAVSNWNCGFDVGCIAYDGTNLWIGCEDDVTIREYTTAGVLVSNNVSTIGFASHLGLTYVSPYLYAMGIYTDGVLVEVNPSTREVNRFHSMKRGNTSYHGLAYDGTYLRHGQGGDASNNSLISKVTI